MKFEQLLWTKESGWQGQRSSDLEADNATLVLYFGGQGSIDSGKRFSELKDRYRNAVVVGCSSRGEIINNQSLDGAVVSLALGFNKTAVRVVSEVATNKTELEETGYSLGQKLQGDSLAGVILLSEGVDLNGFLLVHGLNRALGKNVPLVGGLAIDGEALDNSLVGADSPPIPNNIAAIGLYGDSLDLRYATFHGCKPVSPINIITRSKDNVVYEIAEEPAAQYLRRFVGEELDDSSGNTLLFPIGVRPGNDSEQSYNRTIVEIDKEQQSLLLASDIPENSYIQILRGSLEDLVSAAEIAAEEALGGIEDRSKYVGVLISCVGRKIAHGKSLVAEINAVAQALGEEVPTIGFYAHGEICPHPKTKINELHNHTMTMFFISEK